MKKQIFNDLTAQTLFESEETQTKPKGVLKILRGCVADFKPNRNGRVYPRKLWENVINSEYYKDMIKNKTLFGEADHPEERLELSLQNVSHAIDKIWIDEARDQVWATIHILDTPLGHTVANLVEYGSHLGVSSRGAGEVKRDGSVDPDSYRFMTIDLVCRPSVAAARPAVIVEGEDPNANYISDEELNSILGNYSSNSKKDAECVRQIIYESEGMEKTFNATIRDLVLEDALKSRHSNN